MMLRGGSGNYVNIMDIGDINAGCMVAWASVCTNHSQPDALSSIISCCAFISVR